jgi:hypothetical protein
MKAKSKTKTRKVNAAEYSMNYLRDARPDELVAFITNAFEADPVAAKSIVKDLEKMVVAERRYAEKIRQKESALNERLQSIGRKFQKPRRPSFS